MRLKKCSGCARAIVESAVSCDYCGHANADPIVHAPDVDAYQPEAFPEVDATPDISTPQVAANAADVPAVAPGVEPDDRAFELPDFDGLFDRLPAAHGNADAGEEFSAEPGAPSAEPVAAIEPPANPPAETPAFEDFPVQELPEVYGHTEVTPYGPPAGAGTAGDAPATAFSSLDASAMITEFETDPAAEEAGAAEIVNEDAAGYADEASAAPEFAAAAPPFIPIPVEPVHAPRRSFLSKEMAMGMLGIAAGGVLIFALLSARGAASPEPAATQVQKPNVRQQKAAPAAAQAPGAPAPRWTSNPAAWVGKDRRSAAFELASIGKIQVWMRQVQPMLIVRCRDKAAEAFVFTDSPAKMEPQDGDHTVRIRFDDGPELAERWPDSAEHDALFAPDSAAFVRQLVAARRMHFSFSPHNANTASMTFDVTGLAEHLTTAARQCGWKN